MYLICLKFKAFLSIAGFWLKYLFSKRNAIIPTTSIAVIKTSIRLYIMPGLSKVQVRGCNKKTGSWVIDPESADVPKPYQQELAPR
jgi:hypothetical protein